jgi:hypothetical protein
MCGGAQIKYAVTVFILIIDLGSKVVVRASTDPAEWEEMVRLTNVEGWNESFTDMEVFFKCYPGCLFVALLDGKPVGRYISGINLHSLKTFILSSLLCISQVHQ